MVSMRAASDLACSLGDMAATVLALAWRANSARLTGVSRTRTRTGLATASTCSGVTPKSVAFCARKER